MNLTPDEVAAAKALGCRVTDATAEQIQRLTMQRRIFRIDERPVVIQRGTAPLETHGTLSAIIAKRLAAPRSSVDDLPLPRPEVASVQRDAQPASLVVEPEIAEPEPWPDDAPPVRKRRARKTVPTSEAPPSTSAAIPQAVEHEMLADIDASQDSGIGPSASRQRRAGKQPQPRWITAGKARRGRLK